MCILVRVFLDGDEFRISCSTESWNSSFLFCKPRESSPLTCTRSNAANFHSSQPPIHHPEADGPVGSATTDVSSAVDVTHSTDVCVCIEVSILTAGEPELSDCAGPAWTETMVVLVDVTKTTDVRGLSICVVVTVDMGVSRTPDATGSGQNVAGGVG